MKNYNQALITEEQIISPVQINCQNKCFLFWQQQEEIQFIFIFDFYNYLVITPFLSIRQQLDRR
ncbi:unnamed protein product [Paramecium primaurelia]|uniref:Uncharacterized protein n=1 Tax=Paramecium primaurelia TaxID=5886 RepID=A0A8S1N7C7_PARPR|nr:unnamed protein product [Paramecium primaurelia]